MNDSLWLNVDATSGEPEYTARELRRALSALMTKAGSPDRFGARSGVHPSGAPAVSLSGDTITVLNTTGAIYTALTTVTGPYAFQMLENTHTLAAADGANDRIDLVVAHQYDDDEDASGMRTLVSEYLVGTPGSSPEPPSVPLGAEEWARVTVPASGTGSPTLEFTSLYHVAAGGIIPVRDDAELPGTDGGMYDGLARWKRDTNELQVHNGQATWETVAGDSRPKGIVAGSDFYFSANVGATESVAVTADTAAPITVTFTADANRAYRVTFQVGVADKDGGGDTSTQDAKGACNMRLRYESGSSISTSSSFVVNQQAAVFDGDGDYASGATIVGFFEPSSGTVSVGLTLQATLSGFNVRTFPSDIVIEDIGPAIGL